MAESSTFIQSVALAMIFALDTPLPHREDSEWSAVAMAALADSVIAAIVAPWHGNVGLQVLALNNNTGRRGGAARVDSSRSAGRLGRT